MPIAERQKGTAISVTGILRKLGDASLIASRSCNRSIKMAALNFTKNSKNFDFYKISDVVFCGKNYSCTDQNGTVVFFLEAGYI